LTLTEANLIMKCCFSNNGEKLLICVETDIKLYDAHTGKHLSTLAGHAGMPNFFCFSDDGLQALSSSNDDSTVRIWDTSRAFGTASSTNHTKRINQCSFTPSHDLVVTASLDLTLKLWDTSGQVLHTWDVQDEWRRHSSEDYSSYLFSLTDKHIAIKSQDVVVLLSIQAREIVGKLEGHSSKVLSCLFSSQGVLASTSQHEAIIWQNEPWSKLHTLVGHKEQISQQAFSPNGKLLVTCSVDATLVWDVESGSLQHSFPGAYERVTKLCFSADGHCLFARVGPKQVARWQLEPNEQVTIHEHKDEMQFSTLIASPDDDLLVSTGLYGIVLRNSKLEALDFISASQGTDAIFYRGELWTWYRGHITCWNVGNGKLEKGHDFFMLQTIECVARYGDFLVCGTYAGTVYHLIIQSGSTI